MSPAHGYRAELDGLRGLAALLVVLSHSSKFGLSLAPWLNFDGLGRYGVVLFFVLSAYLLTSQLQEGTLSNWRGWAAYLVRRVLRIYPLHFVALLGVCYLSPATLNPSLAPGDVWEHLILRQGQGVFWTIPVEFTFYLVLPFLVLALGPIRQWPGAVTVAIGAAIVLHYAYGSAYFELSPLVRYLGIFLLAIWVGSISPALANLSHERRYFRIGVEIAGWLALFTLVLVMNPSYYSMIAGYAVAIQIFHEQHLVLAALCVAIVIGISLGCGQLNRLFRAPALVFVGRISFSLYLWHLLVLEWFLLAVPDSLPVSLRTASYWILVVGASSLSFLAIERPAARLGRSASSLNPASASRWLPAARRRTAERLTSS